MRTFFVENFGCRATQADGAALETLLQARGLTTVPQRSQADLVILNTCTVTSGADSDVRAAVRRAHRENPESRIMVTGCYAQRAPDEVAALPGVEWVVGNSHKADIASMVGGTPYHGGIYVGNLRDTYLGQTQGMLSAPVVHALADRARPNLKIQDGCNNRCSFCIIPYVRGASRFSEPDVVTQQVHQLSQQYREVVLTGINLGRWGRHAGSSLRLHHLLHTLLERTRIERIRLSSVEAMDWSDDLIATMAGSERIARHVHMPLQSGSDAILRGMRRKYRPRHYADRILKAHAAMPDAAFGADVITGFPGETDQLFDESLRFIEQLPFTYLHVFTYSERPGTRAAEMAGSVPTAVRRERTRVLRMLSDQRNLEFRRSLSGKTLPVVTLEQSPFALTGNYIRVEMEVWPGPNRLVPVRLGSPVAGGVREQGAFSIL